MGPPWWATKASLQELLGDLQGPCPLDEWETEAAGIKYNSLDGLSNRNLLSDSSGS
jgi:hypothetical protein